MIGSAPTSDLGGWVRAPFSGGGFTHGVYEKGSGPGVVLVPEIPGTTPAVLGLGDHLVEQGFTVAIPSLFGEPGRKPSGGYLAQTFAKVCVSAEFRAFATDARRPVADFLKALTRDLAARTSGARRRHHRHVLHGWVRAGRRGRRVGARAGPQPAVAAAAADRCQAVG